MTKYAVPKTVDEKLKMAISNLGIPPISLQEIITYDNPVLQEAVSRHFEIPFHIYMKAVNDLAGSPPDDILYHVFHIVRLIYFIKYNVYICVLSPKNIKKSMYVECENGAGYEFQHVNDYMNKHKSRNTRILYINLDNKNLQII